MNLLLFTDISPLGSRPTFLDPELEYLSAHFNKIYIFPHAYEDVSANLPSNTECIDLRLDYRSSKARIFRNLFPLVKWTSKYWKRISRQDLMITLSSWLQHDAASDKLISFIREEGIDMRESICYTYWFDNWTNVVSIAKRKGSIGTFISRAHGFDLYNERHKFGFMPFREFHLTKLDQIFAVSDFGTQYLREKHPQFKSKFRLGRLGIVSPVERQDNKGGKKYTMVSCSRLVEVKRVSLIAEAIGKTNLEMEWVHFGGGPLRKEIESQTCNFPGNVLFSLMGDVDNQTILDFYAKRKVDLFINVSSSEGVPISILEATSYGIPILATNVGGTHEAVPSVVGELLDPDISASELISRIEFHLEKEKSPQDKEAAVQFWAENFKSASVYNSFCEELKSIHRNRKNSG